KKILDTLKDEAENPLRFPPHEKGARLGPSRLEFWCGSRPALCDLACTCRSVFCDAKCSHTIALLFALPKAAQTSGRPGPLQRRCRTAERADGASAPRIASAPVSSAADRNCDCALERSEKMTL